MQNTYIGVIMTWTFYSIILQKSKFINYTYRHCRLSIIGLKCLIYVTIIFLPPLNFRTRPWAGTAPLIFIFYPPPKNLKSSAPLLKGGEEEVGCRLWTLSWWIRNSMTFRREKHIIEMSPNHFSHLKQSLVPNFRISTPWTKAAPKFDSFALHEIGNSE